jgi:CHASE3 domain sensor protein
VDLWQKLLLLHPAVQITLVISVVVLLAVIAMNHSAEEKIHKILLALQTILLNNKTSNGGKTS